MTPTGKQTMYVSHFKNEVEECAPYQGGADGIDHVYDGIVAARSEFAREVCKKVSRKNEDG